VKSQLATNAVTGWDRGQHERFCEDILSGFVKQFAPEGLSEVR